MIVEIAGQLVPLVLLLGACWYCIKHQEAQT